MGFNYSAKLNTIILWVVTISFAIIYSVSAQQGAPGQSHPEFKGADIMMDENNEAPIIIRFPEGAGLTPDNFFDEYRSAFQLSSDNRVRLLRSQSDQLGFTHYRYEQFYKEVPLAGVQYLLHDKNGNVVTAHGKLIHNLDLSVTPILSEKDALQAALDHLNAQLYMWEDPASEQFLKQLRNDPAATFYPSGKLMLSAGNQEYVAENFHLVYRFDIFAKEPFMNYYVDVDARNGTIVNKISRIADDDVPGQGTSLYNGTVNMMVDSVNSTLYRLREAGRGSGIQTFDALNQTNLNAAVDFEDTDNIFTAPNDHAGVSLHWGAEQTYDYHLTVHGRNSYDNAGGLIRGYAHFDDGWVNAQWVGSLQIMRFGDGDGTSYDPLVSLDVIGHEFQHGVDQFSSNLIYQAESGALDESFADIFGTLIEFYVEGPNADWLIGAAFALNGVPFRSMSDPNSLGDPDTYFGNFWASLTGGDNGGVHTNSGVQNFWFYLLSEGGSGVNDNGDTYNVTGIGMDQAAHIANRNQSFYLGPSSKYFDARLGAILSAIDLYGENSPQHQSTAEAWDAVGVYYPSLGPSLGLPDTVNFIAEVGVDSDTAEVNLFNGGLDTLMISDIQISGNDFQVTTALSFPIQLNNFLDSLSMNVSFTPTNEGITTETLSITSNDPMNPVKTITLVGKGYVIHPADQGVIYAVTREGAESQLLTLDANNGNGTLVGPSGFDDIMAVTVHPTTGKLYGIANTGETVLVKINAQAGDAYADKVIPVENVRAMTFDNNENLYLAQFIRGELYRVNFNSGDTTFIGNSGARLLAGLAFNPSDNQLYGVTITDRFYRIDQTTGQATQLGSTGLQKPSGLEFDDNGALFGLSGFDGEPSSLISIDPSTGTGTLIGATGFAGITGLAINGSVVVGIDEPLSEKLPSVFRLHQNYPNPFNPTTTLRYDLPEATQVTLTIYNALGQKVRTLVNNRQPAGYRSVTWDGKNNQGKSLSSGVYLYRLEAGSFVQTSKMLLLR